MFAAREFYKQPRKETMSPKIGFKGTDPRVLHGFWLFAVAKARNLYKPRLKK